MSLLLSCGCGIAPTAAVVVEFLVALRDAIEIPVSGRRFTGVCDLLLSHGRAFLVRPGGPLADGFNYVEGFALSYGEPTPHAWLVDSFGLGIEVTWPQPGAEYFGLAIPDHLVRRYPATDGVLTALLQSGDDAVLRDLTHTLGCNPKTP